MSLSKSTVIDLVTILPRSSRVTLVIDDSDTMPDAVARENALMAKLDTYLKFVVSGQFARLYPDYLDRDLCIILVCVEAPTDRMRSIKGIRDHAHPETFLPIEVVSSDEFRAALAKVGPQRQQ
jgi:hypothetical protein